jgi:hypothetical protein
MLSIILAIVASMSTIGYTFASIKIIRMSKDLLEVTNLYNNLEQAVMSEPENAGIDTHTQSFIKFLSDSREMAFDYIDNAQQQIKEFIDIADKQFAFFDSYGMLTQGYPNYEAMEILSKEYKKLKLLLPEETS